MTTAGNTVPVTDPLRALDEARERERADVLAGRICVAASLAAQSEAQLLELIGEFDASGAVRWWSDVKSVAHWLSWACSMAAGTAREHVRVARALRRMPSVQEAFAAGQLSYSKVREVTRVVDVIDESRLCELALTATASQLSRMLAAFRAADGSRIAQEEKRQARWVHREDGMVDFRLRLPAEEAAVLLAAVEAAQGQFGSPPPAAPRLRDPSLEPSESRSGQVDTTPVYGTADAVLDMARTFLASAPEDRSGEDRTLVVVQVAAEQLAEQVGEPNPAKGLEPTSDDGNVPAGTFAAENRQVCSVVGVGPIEPETARRLSCDAELVGAVVDAHGGVLALGRTRRLVSKTLRRALMIRDRMCVFPGCHQVRHLKAHHVRAWASGGRTDLANLVLLCQWHHTAVHEGRMTLRQTPGEGSGWQVLYPDGTLLRPWQGNERLADHLSHMLATQRERSEQQLTAVRRFDDAPARTIRPRWAGEQFDKAACVDALFGMKYATAA